MKWPVECKIIDVKRGEDVHKLVTKKPEEAVQFFEEFLQDQVDVSERSGRRFMAVQSEEE